MSQQENTTKETIPTKLPEAQSIPQTQAQRIDAWVNLIEQISSRITVVRRNDPRFEEDLDEARIFLINGRLSTDDEIENWPDRFAVAFIVHIDTGIEPSGELPDTFRSNNNSLLFCIHNRSFAVQDIVPLRDVIIEEEGDEDGDLEEDYAYTIWGLPEDHEASWEDSYNRIVSSLRTLEEDTIPKPLKK